MPLAEEFASNDTKRFDWHKLPPGEYKFVDGELVPVNEADTAYDRLMSKIASFLDKS